MTKKHKTRTKNQIKIKSSKSTVNNTVRPISQTSNNNNTRSAMYNNETTIVNNKLDRIKTQLVKHVKTYISKTYQDKDKTDLDRYVELRQQFINETIKIEGLSYEQARLRYDKFRLSVLMKSNDIMSSYYSCP